VKKTTELTPDEAKILRHFRAMDAGCKGEYLNIMAWAAERFPAYRPPLLRLIKGSQPCG
jgi:hypothetical protein